MLPNIANNRKLALTISVKFTLILVAVALLFAGMVASAADIGRSNSTGNRQGPIVLDDNFFTSLRFWERNRNQPPARSPATTERDTRPREIPAETRSVPAERPESPVLHRSTTPGATPGLAPIPPPIPHIEHRGGFGNAFMTEWSANVPDAHGRSFTQEMRPNAASHVSYSFDARDWVDFFSLRQEARQQESHESPLAAMRATSLHALAPQTSMPRGEDSDNGEWDGQATQLASIASIREEIERLQSDQTAGPPASSVEAPVERPPIDLTPSFTRLLPHVQTCGVVVVQANFPLTEISSILEEIYMLQHDLTRYIGVPPAREKIELCLFRDERSYLEFLREYFPRAPRDRRALYIKLDNKPGVLLVQKTADFEIDLRHEMTHAIIHASIPRMPIWLDEGLAKYFEVPRHERASGHPYLREVRRNTTLGMIPSLDRLARLETIDDMGAREYRDSWAWTHFLIHRSPETHRLLAAYLQMLANLPEESARTVNVFTGGHRQPPIPSLRVYLDEIMPNQREAFREHFRSLER